MLPGTCSQLTPGGPNPPVLAPPRKPGLPPLPPVPPPPPASAAAGGAAAEGSGAGTAAAIGGPSVAVPLPLPPPELPPVCWPEVRPEVATTASRHATRSWARHMPPSRCLFRRSVANTFTASRSEAEHAALQEQRASKTSGRGQAVMVG